MINGVPVFSDDEQPCVICYDETKFAVKSHCCGAGAACSDCIINTYLTNSNKCMFCKRDTGPTFLHNPTVWNRTYLSFRVMLKHSNLVFVRHMQLLIWRKWYTFFLGMLIWSVIILVAKYLVDGGIQDIFNLVEDAVDGLEIEKQYPDRWK